jgi:hypothetical protein
MNSKSRISIKYFHIFSKKNISLKLNKFKIQNIPFYHLKINKKSPFNKWGMYLIAEQKIQQRLLTRLLGLKYTSFFIICCFLILSSPTLKGPLLVLFFVFMMKTCRFSDIHKINKKTIRKIYLIENRKNEIAVEFFNSRKLLIMRINYISVTNQQNYEELEPFEDRMPITYLKKTFFIPLNIKVYDRQSFDSVLNGIVPYFEEDAEGRKIKYKKLETTDYLSYKI